jgi:membrane protease YdiL (CAAX protease family)
MSAMQTQELEQTKATDPSFGASDRPRRGVVTAVAIWTAFVVAALLLMDVLDLKIYGVVVPLAAVAVALVTSRMGKPVSAIAWARWRVDRKDLVVIGGLYVAIVALFRVAFTVFTADRVAGLFLSFGAALLIGVAGPVVYTVWVRRRPLASLGIGLHNLRSTVRLGLLFAGVQFAITLWGYDLPRPVDWVPLLVMTLTVGMFEAIFFRGFVQGRLEAALGTAPAGLGAAALYALYHVGYGMGGVEMVFLFGLGVVYAVAYRLSENVLVLWPLLIPLGSFFAQLEAGDLVGELPWASVAGFADVLAAMAVVVWMAARSERRRRLANNRRMISSPRVPDRPARDAGSVGLERRGRVACRSLDDGS